MNILVFNSGSSSLNYKVFKFTAKSELSEVCRGKAHRIGVNGDQPAFIEHHQPGKTEKETLPLPDHCTAAACMIDYLQAQAVAIDAVGHRFVHGGREFQSATFINDETLPRLQACIPLAPIHNFNSIAIIQVCLQRLPSLRQYAVFDTAFHAGLPRFAYTYAIPPALADSHSFRKYGFHGLSYQYVTRAAARFLNQRLSSLKIIACHLGTGGSSVTAIANGQSLDTSMGYSPLSGLMMSTRTGDLDPLLPSYMQREFNLDPAELNRLYNKHSGLSGVSGQSSDIRDLIQRMNPANFSTVQDGFTVQDSISARLAFELYCYRLQKMIAGFCTVLGGVDVLIFTDDIGAQNPTVRSEACRNLEWCGIRLDERANKIAQPDRITAIQEVSAPVWILSMPTDEELVIGMEGQKLFRD